LLSALKFPITTPTGFIPAGKLAGAAKLGTAHPPDGAAAVPDDMPAASELVTNSDKLIAAASNPSIIKSAPLIDARSEMG
jgi:hypothetical protein